MYFATFGDFIVFLIFCATLAVIMMIASATTFCIMSGAKRVLILIAINVLGIGWPVAENALGRIMLAGQCPPKKINRSVAVSTFIEKSPENSCFYCNMTTLLSGYEAVEFYTTNLHTTFRNNAPFGERGYFRFYLDSADSKNCLVNERPQMIDGSLKCRAVQKIARPLSRYTVNTTTSEDETSLGRRRKIESKIIDNSDSSELAASVWYQFESRTYLAKFLNPHGAPGFGSATCGTYGISVQIVLPPAARK